MLLREGAPMPAVAELITPFFNWKQAAGNGFKSASRTKYEPHLRGLAAWSGSRDVSSITSASLEFEYLPLWSGDFERRVGRPAAQNTVRLLHNSLSSFFDYCWRRGLITVNPMRAIPCPSYEAPMNDWLSVDEDMALARVRSTPLEDIVCGLARLAGLRVDEIVRCSVADVALNDGLLHVYGRKTAASVRSVVIFPELETKLEAWLAHQTAAGLAHDALPLVSTRDGGPIARPYIWRIVKRVAGRAGIRVHARDGGGRPIARDPSGENLSRVSPHTLRRTFDSDLLNRGVRIEVVSRQLGHADTRITEKAYAKLLSATQKDELLRLGSGYPFLVGEQRTNPSRR
jgi:integrase